MIVYKHKNPYETLYISNSYSCQIINEINNFKRTLASCAFKVKKSLVNSN
jgi:hypothetical protein